MNAAVFAAVLPLTSVTATRAPSRARKCAMVPPIFGPAPNTIATLPASLVMGAASSSCRYGCARALHRHVFGMREPAPCLGGLAVADGLHLAPEDAPHQHDAGVGLPQPLLRAVDDGALAHHGDIVLRRRELERGILRPQLVEKQLVVVVGRIVVAVFVEML